MNIYVPTALNKVVITLTISGAGTDMKGQNIWLDGKCFIVTNQTLDVITAVEREQTVIVEPRLKVQSQPHWIKYNDWRKKAKR